MIYMLARISLQILLRCIFNVWDNKAVFVDIVASIATIPLHLAWVHTIFCPSNPAMPESEPGTTQSEPPTCVLLLESVHGGSRWEPKFLRLPLFPKVLIFGRQSDDLGKPEEPSNGIFSVSGIYNRHATAWADEYGHVWIQSEAIGGTLVNATIVDHRTPSKLQDGDFVSLSAFDVSDLDELNETIAARVRTVNLPAPRPLLFGCLRYLSLSDFRCLLAMTARTILASTGTFVVGLWVFEKMSSAPLVFVFLAIAPLCIAWVLWCVLPEMIALCEMEASMIRPETPTVVSVRRSVLEFTKMRCHATDQTDEGIEFSLKYCLLAGYLHRGAFGQTRERAIAPFFFYVFIMWALGAVAALVLAGELRFLLGGWEEVRRLLCGL